MHYNHFRKKLDQSKQGYPKNPHLAAGCCAIIYETVPTLGQCIELPVTPGKKRDV